MANNRMFLICKTCKFGICLGKNLGGEWFPSNIMSRRGEFAEFLVDHFHGGEVETNFEVKYEHAEDKNLEYADFPILPT